MKLTGSILAIAALTLLSGCEGLTVNSRPPTVSIPGISYTAERLRASDPTIRFLPIKETAGTPTTILTISDGHLEGMIHVRKLGESVEPDNVPAGWSASAYLVAKKSAKHFAWGNGHSCLAQFTNEMYGRSPNNSDLTYQVAGTSNDGKFSVFGSFRITHPKLPSISAARLYKGEKISRVNRHPDMRLIEHAPHSDFRPRIDRIDGIINALRMQE